MVNTKYNGMSGGGYRLPSLLSPTHFNLFVLALETHAPLHSPQFTHFNLFVLTPIKEWYQGVEVRERGIRG
jgi:hypothetical protein